MGLQFTYRIPKNSFLSLEDLFDLIVMHLLMQTTEVEMRMWVMFKIQLNRRRELLENDLHIVIPEADIHFYLDEYDQRVQELNAEFDEMRKKNKLTEFKDWFSKLHFNEQVKQILA